MFGKALKGKTAELLVLVLSAILLSGAVSAAEETVILEPEVVTGSRIYTNLEEVPAPTYVIDREEIERNGGKNLSEILSQIPGIYVTPRNGRTQEDNIKVRGLVTQVLLLVDGVPYYNATHGAGAIAFDLRSIPLAGIERIEIVKGAGSALYGSMAAAGVINIITKKPEGEGFSILGEGGTNDWRRGVASAWATNDDFGVRAWYTKAEEGESPLSSTYGTIDKSLDYDEDSGGVTLTKGPFTFNATWGEYDSLWTYFGSPNRQEDEYSRFNLKWEEGPNRLLVYHHDLERNFIDPWGEYFYETKAWGADFSQRTTWGDTLVSWGTAFRKEDISYDSGTLIEQTRENYAPFVELSRPVGDIILNLGLRYEIWDQDEADDYDEFVPKLSFLYQTPMGNAWYLSAGKFFAMPSVYELFGDGIWTSPNPHLKPEKGYSYEFGVKGADVYAPWNIGVFYMNMDDKIVWGGSIYDNVDEYRAWGIEATKTWPIARFWDLSIGATWMRAEERDTGGSWSRSRAPEWDIDTSFIYQNGPVQGRLTVNYFGNREAGEGVESNVTTVDASIGYKRDASTLRLSVYNLFDEEYWGDEFGGTYYYGPERRIYLSWEYVF